jgi:hypothetical protein
MGKKAVKLIPIKIVDHTGHTEKEVTIDEAVEIIEDQMSNGKWLEIVDANGSSDMVTDFDSFKEDNKDWHDRFQEALGLNLMVALVGGQH